MQRFPDRRVAKQRKPVTTAIAVFAFLIQALLSGSFVLQLPATAVDPAAFPICAGNAGTGTGDQHQPGHPPCCDDGSCLLCHAGLGPVLPPAPPTFDGPTADAVAVRFWLPPQSHAFPWPATYRSRGPPLAA